MCCPRARCRSAARPLPGPPPRRPRMPRRRRAPRAFYRATPGARSIARVGRRGSGSVLRTVLLFAGLGLLLLALVAVVGIVVLRQVATDQAMADARDLTALSARIVEQRLDDGVVRREP